MHTHSIGDYLFLWFYWAIDFESDIADQYAAKKGITPSLKQAPTHTRFKKKKTTNTEIF